MVTEVKTRLKFTKKNDWANKSVRYYSGSGIKRIFFSDVTYLVSGKIEKTKLKNDGEFDDIINNYYKEKKITMPNIKEGSIIVLYTSELQFKS
jgi:hypothetical protein